MGKYIKIHSISVSLLNNAEYLNLMRRFRALIPVGTPGVDDEEEEERPGGLALTDINTQVGITDGELEAFDADVEKLGDAVNQSRVSNETAQMAEADKERDDLIVYFNGSVSNERKSPIQARRDAAVELYNVTKVYVGIQTLAGQQETQQVNGLLQDLEKDTNKAHVVTLGLTEVVEALRTANGKYESLTAARTNARAARTTESAKTIRLRLDEQFDDMLTISFVYSVAYPTTGTATFVSQVNALIDEVKAAYNQRKAQAASHGKGEEDIENGSEERPGGL